MVSTSRRETGCILDKRQNRSYGCLSEELAGTFLRLKIGSEIEL